MYPDEKKESAEHFLRAATQYLAGLCVPIQRVITDYGPAFHSAAFGAACLELGIAQKFTRAYRPQANGKAERFIQSALREWAYKPCLRKLAGPMCRLTPMDPLLQLAPPTPRYGLPANIAVILLQTIGRAMRNGCPVQCFFVDRAWAEKTSRGELDDQMSGMLVQLRVILQTGVASDDPREGALYRALYGAFRFCCNSGRGASEPVAPAGDQKASE